MLRLLALVSASVSMLRLFAVKVRLFVTIFGLSAIMLGLSTTMFDLSTHLSASILIPELSEPVFLSTSASGFVLVLKLPVFDLLSNFAPVLRLL